MHIFYLKTADDRSAKNCTYVPLKRAGDRSAKSCSFSTSKEQVTGAQRVAHLFPSGEQVTGGQSLREGGGPGCRALGGSTAIAHTAPPEEEVAAKGLRCATSHSTSCPSRPPENSLQEDRGAGVEASASVGGVDELLVPTGPTHASEDSDASSLPGMACRIPPGLRVRFT